MNGQLTFTTETVTTTTYALGNIRVQVRSTLSGQHFGVVHDADGAAVMGGHDAATPEQAFALALSEALDSSVIEWYDVDASVTQIMLALVGTMYGGIGDHENTGGGTMCATWIHGDHVAVMGDDDCTIGFYVADQWFNGLSDGSTAEPYAVSDSTDFGSAMTIVGRFLGRETP